MKTFVACFLGCLCMSGCAPQRRLNRLVTWHPKLITVDTVRFRKIYPLPGKTALMPLFVERFYGDLNEKHSVTVTDSVTGISVSIADSAARDTLTMSVSVPPDTLKTDEPVPVKTVTVTPPIERHWMKNLPLLLLIVIVLIVVERKNNCFGYEKILFLCDMKL